MSRIEFEASIAWMNRNGILQRCMMMHERGGQRLDRRQHGVGQGTTREEGNRRREREGSLSTEPGDAGRLSTLAAGLSLFDGQCNDRWGMKGREPKQKTKRRGSRSTCEHRRSVTGRDRGREGGKGERPRAADDGGGRGWANTHESTGCRLILRRVPVQIHIRSAE